MLRTGIFPDNFKLAKVIPLFKKGDFSLLIQTYLIIANDIKKKNRTTKTYHEKATCTLK